MHRPVLRKRPLAALVAAALFVTVCVLATTALEASDRNAHAASAEDQPVSE